MACLKKLICDKMLYRQSGNRSDRSVQLTNRRLRACRGENYFKSKGSEISVGHERPLCHVKRYFLMLVHTYDHKETGNWCVLVKPLRQRKHASVWCMTQKAIVTGCSHLLELRLATSYLFPYLSSTFPFPFSIPSYPLTETFDLYFSYSLFFPSGVRVVVELQLIFY